MNTVKKIIAVITIAIIIIRTFAFEAFAFAGAPVIAAEEITTLLETALIGSGLYTESELEGKSYLELNDLLKDGINSGQINPRTNYYTDPISGLQFGLMDLFTKPEVQAGIGITKSVVNNVVGNAVNDWFSGVNGEEIYDFINPTYSNGFELLDGGASFKHYFKDGSGWEELYSYDTGIVYIKTNGDETWKEYHLSNCFRKKVYKSDGRLLSDRELNGKKEVVSCRFQDENDTTLYGKWALEDGTQVDTDDESIPVIGEADGVQITPDMLNPDGTVTIDGITYYPKDFIDWDKFKDPAIIDLLNQILSKIDTAPVAEPDTTKDLVDSITGSVSVPDELSDYIIPAGISSVFPFCLPFDLYRGIKLLSAKPVAPVLEIPFEVPEFGYFEGYKTVLTINFEEYDKYFSVFRWGIYFIFALSLVFISTKIVKGAGA